MMNRDECCHSNRRINSTDSQCTKCGLVLSPTGEPFARDSRASDAGDPGDFCILHATAPQGLGPSTQQARRDSVWQRVEEAVREAQEQEAAAQELARAPATRRAISAERVQKVYEGVGLSREQREFVKLKSRGLTQTQIAAKRKISQPAVSKRWSTIVKKLKSAEMLREGYDHYEVEGQDLWGDHQRHNGRSMAVPLSDATYDDGD